MIMEKEVETILLIVVALIVICTIRFNVLYDKIDKLYEEITKIETFLKRELPKLNNNLNNKEETK